MTGLTVHGNHFRRDGAPQFLLADTAWAAVPRSGAQEWQSYLDHRRRQGFTAVLLSVLPIPHGRSVGAADRAPFPVRPDGGRDHGRPDREYLRVMRERVAAVSEAGLTPMCVLVWNNYVPGTWGARRTPGFALTRDELSRYVGLVLHALAGLEPVWLISGDEAFEDEQTLGHYETALRLLRSAVPGALAGAHPAVDALPPAGFAAELDFHAYQSGHDKDHLPRCTTLADRLRRRRAQGPIVNLEPCYEDHLAAGSSHRHTAADVRRAAWTSVLGGATAGIGYGAHGVWSWHRAGDRFTDPAYAGEPATVDEALRLDGAHDMVYLRRAVEHHRLFDLAPRPQIAASPPVPVAATEDLSAVAAFVPAGTSVRITGTPAGARRTTLDLERRRPVADGGPPTGDTVAVVPSAATDRVVLFGR